MASLRMLTLDDTRARPKGLGRQLAAIAGALVIAALASGLGSSQPRAQQPADPPPPAASEPPAPAPPPAPPVAVPVAPADPRAAKAYAALEQHCAPCHQAGRLTTPTPAARIGNILDLAVLAADPALVTPGNPEASRLYVSMFSRAMPPYAPPPAGADGGSPAAAGSEPVSRDIAAVRDWIESLPPAAGTCTDRSQLTADAVQALMRRALTDAGENARSLRFVGLTHLHNDCLDAKHLAAYRQGVTRLLNSLSWQPDAARLTPLDAAGTLLMVDLGALGWVGAHWELLAQSYPYSDVAGLSAAPDIVKITGSRNPLVAADWLALAATRPQRYYDLLGLPAELEDLEKLLGFDLDDAITQKTARRAGIKRSAVTGSNRLVEFQPRGDGGLWIAHDFIGSDGERNLMQRPLSPHQSNEPTHVFQADGRRLMFPLPNGLPAFAVYDRTGTRLNRAVAPTPGSDAGFGEADTGAGCLACHIEGPRSVVDELREAVTAPGSPLPRSVRTTALDLHPPLSELKLLLDEEAFRYRRALFKAQVEPEALVGGIDPISALIREHERPLTITRFATEHGLPLQDLQLMLASARGRALMPARRLLSGNTLPRSLAARLHTMLDRPGDADASSPTTPHVRSAEPGAGMPEGPGTTPASAPTPAAASTAANPDLALVADATTYKSGALATFRIESAADCHLTLINVNTQGKATVLYPNDFEQDNRIFANQPVVLPGPGAPYQLRFKHPGTETFIALCPTHSRFPEGIQPDYEQQRFTVLGDWGNFLRAVYDGDAAKAADAKREAPRARRGQRARGRDRDGDKPGETRIIGEPEGRAAIRVRIE